MRLRGSSAGKKPFLVTLKEDRSSSNPSCCVTAWGDIVKGTHSGHLEELLYRGEGERERERDRAETMANASQWQTGNCS